MDPKPDVIDDGTNGNPADNEEVVLDHNEMPVMEEPWWYPQSGSADYDG